MEGKSELIASTPDREVAHNRLLNASPDLVFRAWTEPQHLKKWWGPNGFTNTFEEFEPVQGGCWKFVMHGPDGKNYQNECKFLLLEPFSLIIFDHISPPVFRIVAGFETMENNTLLTWKMIFPTKEEFEKLRAFVAEKNEENLDRLEAELTQMQSQKK